MKVTFEVFKIGHFGHILFLVELLRRRVFWSYISIFDLRGVEYVSSGAIFGHISSFFVFPQLFQVICFFFCRGVFLLFFHRSIIFFSTLPHYVRSLFHSLFISFQKCLKRGSKIAQKLVFEGNSLRGRFWHFFGPSFVAYLKSPFVSRGVSYFLFFRALKRSSLFRYFLFLGSVLFFFIILSRFSARIAVVRVGFFIHFRILLFSIFPFFVLSRSPSLARRSPPVAAHRPPGGGGVCRSF